VNSATIWSASRIGQVRSTMASAFIVLVSQSSNAQPEGCALVNTDARS
jgi:hypothetical protein